MIVRILRLVCSLRFIEVCAIVAKDLKELVDDIKAAKSDDESDSDVDSDEDEELFIEKN